MWNVILTKKATADLETLDGSVQWQVVKAIQKTAQNPLPTREGGYGVELGNKNGTDLTGCLKIKLKKAGIRVVYTLERTKQGMKVIVIGMRDDDEVYKEAARRLGGICAKVYIRRWYKIYIAKTGLSKQKSIF